MENKNNEGKFHLYKMDVLRGFAILMVFSLHSLQNYTSDIEVRKGSLWLLDFSNEPWYLTFFTITPIGYGWTGVQLFFIISGFLIHLIYLRSGKNYLDNKVFFLKRFFRIFPPYLLVLFFIAFMSNAVVFKSAARIWDLIAHILMIHNFQSSTFFSFVGAFWSLAIEVQLYLLYPLFLFFRKKIGIKNTVFILFFISAIIRASYYFIEDEQLGFFIQNSVFKHWIIWGLGALFAENFFNGKQIFKFKIKYLILLFFAVSTIKAFPITFLVNDIIWAFFYLALIDTYLNNANNEPLFIEKVLIFFGISSYSFYLIHGPILHGLKNVISVLGASKHWPIFHIADTMFILLFVQLISVGCYYAIELPSIKLGKQIIEKVKDKRKQPI